MAFTTFESLVKASQPDCVVGRFELVLVEARGGLKDLGALEGLGESD